MAAETLTTSTARLVLLVSAESLFANALHVLDWKTSSLFGEGAAAFLLERGETEQDETYLINGYDARQGSALCYQTLLRRDATLIAEVDKQIFQHDQEGISRRSIAYFPTIWSVI